MSKNYIVKWYDWQAGHYKEKKCTSEQLNPLFLKLKSKKKISHITITEINTIEFSQHFCPICKVYQIFKKKDNNKYRCMKCGKYTLTFLS